MSRPGWKNISGRNARAWTRAAGVGLLAAGLAIFSGPASRAATADEAPVIRVGAALDDQGRPIVYAQQAGIFKKYGLDVQVSRMANGPAVAAAVAGGSLEFGKASTFAIIQAYAKGLPFTIVADIAYYDSQSPDTGLAVGVRSPITAPKDFVGKTIGVSALSDLNATSIRAWLAQNGVDPAQVKFIEVPPPAAVAAIVAGRIDGAFLLEPIYSAALAEGNVRIVARPYDAIARRWSDTAVFANTDWVKAHRDVVVRFTRALADSSAYIAGHETETAGVMAQFIGLDPATVVQLRHPGRSLSTQPAALQPVIDFAAKYNFIPKTFRAQDLICDCAISRIH
jgi:NitT/TauT family transport system substrate-binding protein